MSVVNGILRALFDGVLFPFRGMAPVVGLAVVSAIAAVGVLLVYRLTSNQAGISAVKARIQAGVYEVRLSGDDLVLTLRAMGGILVRNLRYLGLSLVPLAWMIIPFVLVLAQLNFHYAHGPLTPGEPVVLKVELDPEWAADLGGESRPPVTLDAPEGLRVETGGAWVPSEATLAWRIVPERTGNWEVTVRAGDSAFGKSVHATPGVHRRAPERLAASFLDQLLYPAETALPADGPVRAIRLAYPATDVSLFGWKTHWMVVFLILSIVFALAFRKRFGVDF
jgi:hypothetical protein